MSEWTYIGIAYGLTWVTLAVYALLLHRRARRVEAAAASSGTDRRSSGRVQP